MLQAVLCASSVLLQTFTTNPKFNQLNIWRYFCVLPWHHGGRAATTAALASLYCSYAAIRYVWPSMQLSEPNRNMLILRCLNSRLLPLCTAPPSAQQYTKRRLSSVASCSSSAFCARRTQHPIQQHAHKRCTTMLTPVPGGSGGDPYAAIIKDCAAATKSAMQVCSAL
jgi:hypothetical protein